VTSYSPSSQQLLVNYWLHLAVTFSSTTASIYINGLQTSQNTLPTPNTAIFYAINYIGKCDSIFPAILNTTALIDDLYVYSRALSQAELINKLSYDSAYTLAAFGLINFWRFDASSLQDVAKKTTMTNGVSFARRLEGNTSSHFYF
jgi:hypothetical protein